MNFELSEKTKDLQQRLTAFMEEHINPNEQRFNDEIQRERWSPTRIIEELKPKARDAGLWNLFLPHDEHGAGLSNLEYAPLCEIMGRSTMAPEVFNCSAPDTGNMEVLARYGTPEQQERWLEPLLAGDPSPAREDEISLWKQTIGGRIPWRRQLRFSPCFHVSHPPRNWMHYGPHG